MYGERPTVLSGKNLGLALAIHLAAFVGLWIFAVLHGFFEPKETIIPIDLTVIVNENLDGKENEPPPLKKPEPEPPKPKPLPKPKPIPKPEPKALEQIVTNVVKTVEKKEEKKDEPKKKDTPKPKEDPKKALEDRLKAMRESAVKNKDVKINVKEAKKSGDGKTAKQNMSKVEIEKFLNQGYNPGTDNQIAKSEVDRCVRLIKMSLKDKWKELSPSIGNEGIVTLSFKLNSNGGLIDVRVHKSSGDAVSDAAARLVASKLYRIRGLSSEFIEQCRKEPCVINYTIEKQ